MREMADLPAKRENLQNAKVHGCTFAYLLINSALAVAHGCAKWQICPQRGKICNSKKDKDVVFGVLPYKNPALAVAHGRKES